MTSSVQPPVLNPSLGTPSGEWAEKTTSSFDPSSKDNATPQNTTSGKVTSQSPGATPGSEFPGAFPRGETSTGPTNITDTIVDTAKQYLPSSVMGAVGTYFGKPLSPNKQEQPFKPHMSYKAAITTTLQELQGPTKRSELRSTTSITNPRFLPKNYVEPCLMNVSEVWGLSPGLPSRKVWPSSQTKRRNGRNVTPLPDATPLGITPQVTVSLTLIVNHYPRSPSLSPREGNRPYSNRHPEGDRPRSRRGHRQG